MKFVMLVEGATERGSLPAFFKRWLDPQLKQKVRIKIVNMKGNQRFLSEFKAHVDQNLTQESDAELIAVVGLLDLYRLDIIPTSCKTVEEQYTWGKNRLESQINDERFKMFFAVQEIEAWLFSDLQIFPEAVRKSLRPGADRPEEIAVPSKLLGNTYRARLNKDYHKVIYGAGLFNRLDPQRAIEKCPYFKQMLDWMLNAAQQKGA